MTVYALHPRTRSTRHDRTAAGKRRVIVRRWNQTGRGRASRAARIGDRGHVPTAFDERVADAEGAAAFDGVPVGTVNAWAETPEGEMGRKDGRAVPGGRSEVTVLVSPAQDVEVRVYDAATKKPVAGARVVPEMDAQRSDSLTLMSEPVLLREVAATDAEGRTRVVRVADHDLSGRRSMRRGTRACRSDCRPRHRGRARAAGRAVFRIDRDVPGQPAPGSTVTVLTDDDETVTGLVDESVCAYGSGEGVDGVLRAGQLRRSADRDAPMRSAPPATRRHAGGRAGSAQPGIGIGVRPRAAQRSPWTGTTRRARPRSPGLVAGRGASPPTSPTARVTGPRRSTSQDDARRRSCRRSADAGRPHALLRRGAPAVRRLRVARGRCRDPDRGGRSGRCAAPHRASLGVETARNGLGRRPGAAYGSGGVRLAPAGRNGRGGRRVRRLRGRNAPRARACGRRRDRAHRGGLRRGRPGASICARAGEGREPRASARPRPGSYRLVDARTGIFSDPFEVTDHGAPSSRVTSRTHPSSDAWWVPGAQLDFARPSRPASQRELGSSGGAARSTRVRKAVATPRGAPPDTAQRADGGARSSKAPATTSFCVLTERGCCASSIHGRPTAWAGTGRRTAGVPAKAAPPRGARSPRRRTDPPWWGVTPGPLAA